MGKVIYILLLFFFLSGTSCSNSKHNQKQEHQPDDIQNEEKLRSASNKYLKAWSENDTILLKEIAIRNFVRNVNGEITSSNQKGLSKTVQFWHTAQPDFKVIGREIVIKGNRTYINWTGTGTHTGMFGTITPTGKKNKTEGFSVLTFDNSNQIIHETVYYDLLGLMEGWGFTVNPPNLE